MLYLTAILFVFSLVLGIFSLFYTPTSPGAGGDFLSAITFFLCASVFFVSFYERLKRRGRKDANERMKRE